MFKRMICFIMAVFLAAGVCACSDGAKKTSDPNETTASPINTDGSTSIYNEKEIGSQSGIKSPVGSRIDVKGQLVVLDRNDGKNPMFVTLDGDGKPAGEVKCQLPGQPMAFDLDSKGNFWTLVSSSKSENESTQEICVVDQSGKVIKTIPLGSFNFTKSSGPLPLALDIALDASDNGYLATLGGIRVFDASGKEKKKIGADGFYSIDTDGDNKILVTHDTKGKFTLEKLDPASGSNLWSVDLSTAGDAAKAASTAPNTMKVRTDHGNKSIYLLYDNGVLKFDNAGKITGTLLDFKLYSILSSGSSPFELNINEKGNVYVEVLSKDNKFQIYYYDILGGTHKTKSRQTLTLAVPTADKWLQIAAAKFQSVNQDYRVDIKEYTPQQQMNSNTADNESFIKTINTEILTGKGPDILFTGGLPYEKYIEKNMLADLGELMENDKGFDKKQYFTNIIDAFKYKDHLYTLPISFNFDLFTADKKTIAGIQADDGHWNWNDFKALGQKTGNKKLLQGITARSLLDRMLQGNYGAFVDSDNKKASFDSKDFTDLLETAKTLGEKDVQGKSGFGGDGNFSGMNADSDAAVFAPQSFSAYTNFAFINALYNDQAALLNMPTLGNKTGNVFSSNAVFALNNNSKQKEGAWEFLKFLLSPEVQKDELGGFPLNREALKTVEKQQMDMLKSGSMVIGIKGKSGAAKMLRPKALKQSEIDAVNSRIEALSVYSNVNQAVRKIVLDEADAFFSGQKSASDAAKVIESKVNLYLGE